jgi:hypothetical protein
LIFVEIRSDVIHIINHTIGEVDVVQFHVGMTHGIVKLPGPLAMLSLIRWRSQDLSDFFLGHSLGNPPKASMQPIILRKDREDGCLGLPKRLLLSATSNYEHHQNHYDKQSCLHHLSTPKKPLDERLGLDNNRYGCG